MTGPEEGGPFDEELFSSSTYEAPRPQRREFQPWHRPRKHFVRQRQWTEAIARVMSHAPPDRPLRYLGLPGPDLLDIRHFHSSLCGDGDRPMLFLGFNRAAAGISSAGIELNTALDEVRRLPNVDGRSDVIGDDFRSVAREGSMGYRSVLNLAPFDVINIDLCDGLLRDEVGGAAGDQTMYDAIGQILTLQQRNPDRWVLLLTTRVGPDHEDRHTVERLAEAFNANLDDCDGFAAACAELLGEVPSWDPAPADPITRFKLLSMYICKWLLNMLVDCNASVELASSSRYCVHQAGGEPDLLSLVFRVEPQRPPVRDRAGLAHAREQAIDECALAHGMLSRLGNMLDVDDILSEQPAVRDEMMAAMVELLESAQYDIADYVAWVGSEATPASS